MDNHTQDVFVRYTALGPIMHQEPSDRKGGKGNETYSRQMKVMTFDEATGLTAREIPAVSFNSLRCITRRNFTQEVLHRLGLMKNWKYDPGLSGDVVMMLLNGGSTGVGPAQETPYIDKYVEVYDKLPFFGLLGGCYGKTFFAGRLSGDYILPIMYGTKPLLIKMGSPFAEDSTYLPDDPSSWGRNTAGFVRFGIKGVKSEQGLVSFLGAMEEHLELVEAVSEDFDEAENEQKEKVSLTNTEALLKNDKDLTGVVLKYFKKEDDKDSLKTAIKCIRNLTGNQMLYFLKNTIPAGAQLHTRLSLLPGYGDNDLMEATFHAYIEMLLARNYIGGMAAKGYGAVATEAKVTDNKEFKDISRGKEFWDWVDQHKEEVKNDLINFNELLFGSKKEPAVGI